VFERFTDRARRVVVLAQEEARMLSHGHIGTEHLLLALLREGEGLAAETLDALGVELDSARRRVGEAAGPGKDPGGHIPFTPRAKKVLELSLREALTLGHNYIGTEHLLLGLIREGDGLGAQILIAEGHDLEEIRGKVLDVLKKYRGRSPEGLEVGPPEFLTRNPVNEKLDRLQETLNRIERRLDAMGAPPDPARAAGAGPGPGRARPTPPFSGHRGPGRRTSDPAPRGDDTTGDDKGEDDTGADGPRDEEA
jgi:ATP-dependent Clp protease ATP-binding subunit ClpC